MKSLNILTVAALCVLVACNNEKKPGITITDEDGKKVSISSDGLAVAAEDLQKKSEALQKLSPYTLDQMKALLPEELAGVKRSEFNANSAMGTAYAEAKYIVNDSTDFELKIFDCAGQAGAGLYSLQYMGMINYQSESDHEYTKTIDFKGVKAIEHLDKEDNDATLTWLSGDRLLVTLEGNNTGLDMLKQIASSLELK